MSVKSFQSLDVTRARQTIQELYEQVADGKGRIELTREGSHETCVMISKTELDYLEKALEILSDGDDMRNISRSLERLVPSVVAPPTSSRFNF